MAKAESPDIPDRRDDFDNPFGEGTFLHELFGKVYREERDVVFIISDMRGRRGTGKTIASMQLANGMDQTQEGLTFSKCSISPEQLRNAYSNQPKTSGLVLDEGEVGAGNRDAMSKTNKALREIMSMARVKQKYVVVNAPLKGFIDKDILKLADVWIAMTRRGRGLVHYLKWEPYSETLHTQKMQHIEIPDIPRSDELREVYNQLSREKDKHIDGDEGTRFIPMEEHREELKKARKEARKEQRNEDIRGIYEHPEHEESDAVSQRTIGESVGISQQQVGNILREG